MSARPQIANFSWWCRLITDSGLFESRYKPKEKRTMINGSQAGVEKTRACVCMEIMWCWWQKDDSWLMTARSAECNSRFCRMRAFRDRISAIGMFFVLLVRVGNRFKNCRSLFDGFEWNVFWKYVKCMESSFRWRRKFAFFFDAFIKGKRLAKLLFYK